VRGGGNSTASTALMGHELQRTKKNKDKTQNSAPGWDSGAQRSFGKVPHTEIYHKVRCADTNEPSVKIRRRVHFQSHERRRQLSS